MTVEKKILSFDDLIADADIKTDDVETPRGLVKIGTLCSADILEWFTENDDPELRKLAGLRLLVKSIINPDGKRIGADAKDAADLKQIREVAVQALMRRDSRENNVLIRRALELNGLRAAVQGPLVTEKNDSSETKSVVSPIASPSQSVN